MFTINEFKKTLEEMREVHPFSDDAEMTFERDLPSGIVDIVSVYLTVDDVNIQLTKQIKHEAKEW